MNTHIAHHRGSPNEVSKSAAQRMTLLTTVVAICFLSTALACDGIELKNLVMEDCSQDKIYELVNIRPELRGDCTVVMHGCVDVKKQINWYNFTWSGERKSMGVPLKYSGKEDMCKAFADLESSKYKQEILLALEMFDNFKPKCPIKPGKICGSSKPVSVAKYKSHIKMLAGADYGGSVNGKSNAGTVCLKGTGTVTKKGGARGIPSMPTLG